MDGITKILTTIKVSKGGSVRVASSDAEREGEANIVTFNPATETNITNPLNGETIAVSGRRLPTQRNSINHIIVYSVTTRSRAQCWAQPR